MFNILLLCRTGRTPSASATNGAASGHVWALLLARENVVFVPPDNLHNDTPCHSGGPCALDAQFAPRVANQDRSDCNRVATSISRGVVASHFDR